MIVWNCDCVTSLVAIKYGLVSCTGYWRSSQLCPATENQEGNQKPTQTVNDGTHWAKAIHRFGLKVQAARVEKTVGSAGVTIAWVPTSRYAR